MGLVRFRVMVKLKVRIAEPVYVMIRDVTQSPLYGRHTGPSLLGVYSPACAAGHLGQIIGAHSA